MNTVPLCGTGSVSCFTVVSVCGYWAVEQFSAWHTASCWPTLLSHNCDTLHVLFLKLPDFSTVSCIYKGWSEYAFMMQNILGSSFETQIRTVVIGC